MLNQKSKKYIRFIAKDFAFLDLPNYEMPKIEKTYY